MKWGICMESYIIKPNFVNVKRIILIIIIVILIILIKNVSINPTKYDSNLAIDINEIKMPLSDLSYDIQSKKSISVSKYFFDEKPIFNRDIVDYIKIPTADGIIIYNNEFVDIDASNTSEGYFMLKFKSNNEKLIKIVRIANTETKLNYDYYLNVLNEYVTFPLTDGDGIYTIQVFEQEGSKFVLKNSVKIDVVIEDDIQQFTYPNYYVNYTSESKGIKMAEFLCENLNNDIEKAREINNYVLENLTYDFDLAANMPIGYVPDLDRVITEKTGVCFDYAALLTAMLRSVGIPTKLVFGYVENVYHAWISIYTNGFGWIDNIILLGGAKNKYIDDLFDVTKSKEEKDLYEYTVSYIY